jgi:NitT/TauT family transport system ATP-binding protein
MHLPGRAAPPAIPPVADPSPILSAQHLTKRFKTPRGEQLDVLEDVSLTLEHGEIVALLGRSGSGKSTLLRCLIGLLPPTSGVVRYRGRPVVGPMPGMALVFQSFALFPWLTVQANVELGLEAQGVPKTERARRALEAIDLIGLDGFESAYPKELSGGMRQRVGFARALVTQPDVLFMDEPFSALDVLSAESLRAELLELWLEARIPTRSILLVTHNIEEAVMLADRILVLSAHPGRLRTEVSVSLPHPRDRDGAPFRDLVERVYTIMTTPTPQGAPVDVNERPSPALTLPRAPVAQLTGLLERVARGPDFGRDDLPVLAREMQLGVDALLPLTDAAELLGFARVTAGDITLSASGHAFVDADTLRRKVIFAEHLIRRVPLAAHVRRVLDAQPGGRAPKERFVRELEAVMDEASAQEVLGTLIDWGRYAELLAYDDAAGMLSLEPEPAV